MKFQNVFQKINITVILETNFIRKQTRYGTGVCVWRYVFERNNAIESRNRIFFDDGSATMQETGIAEL